VSVCECVYIYVCVHLTEMIDVRSLCV